MLKENTTTNTFLVLSDMALVMSDFQTLADIDEQQDTLETVERAFLCSDFADSNALRNSALVIMDQVKKFYQVLSKYEPKDVKAALDNLQKYNQDAVLS